MNEALGPLATMKYVTFKIGVRFHKAEFCYALCLVYAWISWQHIKQQFNKESPAVTVNKVVRYTIHLILVQPH